MLRSDGDMSERGQNLRNSKKTMQPVPTLWLEVRMDLPEKMHALWDADLWKKAKKDVMQLIRAEQSKLSEAFASVKEVLASADAKGELEFHVQIDDWLRHDLNKNPLLTQVVNGLSDDRLQNRCLLYIYFHMKVIIWEADKAKPHLPEAVNKFIDDSVEGFDDALALVARLVENLNEHLLPNENERASVSSKSRYSFSN